MSSQRECRSFDDPKIETIHCMWNTSYDHSGYSAYDKLLSNHKTLFIMMSTLIYLKCKWIQPDPIKMKKLCQYKQMGLREERRF